MLSKKLHIFLWSLLFLHASPLFTQPNNDISYIPAELWTVNGDTLHVVMEYMNQFNMQYKVTVIDSSSTEYYKYYSPKDLIGFQYNTDSITFKKFISMPNPTDMGRMLLNEVYKGKFSLYKLYEMDYSRTVITYIPTYLLWDKQWIKPAISRDFELKALLHHFSDCPNLAYKIKIGEYGIAHIDTIISIYENCELTDEYEFFYE